jgi:hypothetical protein
MLQLSFDHLELAADFFNRMNQRTSPKHSCFARKRLGKRVILPPIQSGPEPVFRRSNDIVELCFVIPGMTGMTAQPDGFQSASAPF